MVRIDRSLDRIQLCPLNPRNSRSESPLSARKSQRLPPRSRNPARQPGHAVAACDAERSCSKRAATIGASIRSRPIWAICADPEIDAVVIATPNFTHRPMAVAAAKAGKHVMCEKPLGLNAGEVREMYVAARDAGVVHMTAFTYRFAAMRYLRHLVKTAAGALGQPRHFRSQRFLDWPETSWGWRQYKDKAGAGDLFDMTIHRIDFAIDLLGPIEQVCGAVARFAAAPTTADGKPCPPSDVDDWSSLIGEFANGATGVWEGTTLAKGYGRKGFGHEWAEINGSERSAVYQLHVPNTILLGKTGSDLAPQPVPAGVPEAGRQPAQSQARRAGHGVPLRLGVGIRFGDCRRARRRAELLRRTECANRGRRRARIARRATMDRYAAGRSSGQWPWSVSVEASRPRMKHCD